MKILDEIAAYMKAFIEKPCDVFGGLPVCPFAKKARTEGRIDFQVGPFSLEDAKDESELMKKIRAFGQQDQFQVIMFVHPDKTGLNFEDLNIIIKAIEEKIKPDFRIFGGHPDDDYQVQGVYTRKDPYPNFQVISVKLLEESRAKIDKTDYFKNYQKD